jgi:hypothetical protein
VSALGRRRWARADRWVDKGKKFNARKETAKNEEYYGIKIFRFYIVRSRFIPPRPLLASTGVEKHLLFVSLLTDV